MRYAVVSALIAVALAASAGELPQSWTPHSTDPVADALQLWRLGADYFSTSPANGDVGVRALRGRREVPAFEGYATWTRRFLLSPHLAPGVQFSCVRSAHPEESVVKEALKNAASPEVRLQALTLLMKLRSPSTVSDQWAALQELKKLDKGTHWKTLLSELESAFSSRALETALKEWQPPAVRDDDMSRYGDLPPAISWAIRAAGLTQCKALLPRIRQWSANDHLDTSLEAEWSLEQYQGEDADEALAFCVKGWQYNASGKAARVLNLRNPKFLIDTLIEMGQPKDRLYEYARLLAEAGDARAVPLLCQTVKEISIVDGGMFQSIEKLARKEDLPLIQALPKNVRDDQKERAEKVLHAVLARLQ
ncbi:MAG TPA: hypothetical protein VEK08_06225 [Planctomycetota bacterium]|nr:hypothetical protein [Planctomycetota bacterium]